MFVHPSQVVSIMRRHPEIGKARLVVSSSDGADHMNLNVELKSGMRVNGEAIVASIREITTCVAQLLFALAAKSPKTEK